jgi:hypothetical protein
VDASKFLERWLVIGMTHCKAAERPCSRAQVG